MILSNEVVKILSNGVKRLKGGEKRRYMAEAVNSLGHGGQRACERQLGWCRNTIRKGWREVKNHVNCLDNFSARGRKKSEEKNPKLVEHIQEIVDASSQADPSMQSSRLYIKITCSEIRKQLKQCYHYDESSIPVKEVIRRILNENNYYLKKVRKTLPKKKDTRNG